MRFISPFPVNSKNPRNLREEAKIYFNFAASDTIQIRDSGKSLLCLYEMFKKAFWLYQVPRTRMLLVSLGLLLVQSADTLRSKFNFIEAEVEFHMGKVAVRHVPRGP